MGQEGPFSKHHMLAVHRTASVLTCNRIAAMAAYIIPFELVSANSTILSLHPGTAFASASVLVQSPLFIRQHCGGNVPTSTEKAIKL